VTYSSLPAARRVTLSTLFATLLLAVGARDAHAQTLGNSPYSRLGLGEMSPGTGLVRNQGMAGVGVASSSTTYINERNPALAWHTRYVTFDVGLTGQIKTLKTKTQSQRTGNATLNYLALALPIQPHWGAVLGLRPFSTVDYENRSEIGVAGDPLGRVEVRSKGEGGLTQAYMAHGFRIAGGLSAGVEASYVFGSVEAITSTRLLAGTDIGEGTERTVILERRRYGDFLARGGLAYEQKIGSKGMVLTGGLTAEFGRDLNVQRRRVQERRLVTQADQITESLLLADSVKSSAKLPGALTAGVGLANASGTRSLAAEFWAQPWSEFQIDGAKQSALGDAWRFSVGGEWTPDPSSVESYFRRMTYRVGLYTGENGWRDRSGVALRDAGVTWGFALPLGKVATFEGATLQTSFAYGQRGFNSSTGVRDTYLRGQIGVAFSSIWFVKRRIE
jgi:hypothetical protein